MYLGGCNINDKNSCLKIANGNPSTVGALKCFYDEADDRLMFHLNHAVKLGRFEVAHVLTGDTDIFVNLMYHFRDWSDYGLLEIWCHHLNKMSPVHEAVYNLPDDVVRILPAIHALRGCDTTSKVGTKLQAFKAAHKPEYAALNRFGVDPLNEEMFELAEHFLLECATRVKNRKEETFDELRYSKYHSLQYKMDLQTFPCTSNTIRIIPCLYTPLQS